MQSVTRILAVVQFVYRTKHRRKGKNEHNEFFLSFKKRLNKDQKPPALLLSRTSCRTSTASTYMKVQVCLGSRETSIWYISSNTTTRGDGSRSGYVKTTLLISIVLFPKYFIITKSDIHTVVLTSFVYSIFRQNFNIT